MGYRLRNEKVDHPFFSTPSQSQYYTVGEMKFIATVALRLHYIIIREYGKIIGIYCFGSCYGIMQYGVFYSDFTLWHLGSFRVAQQPWMYPRKMSEISKIFNLP